MPRKGLNPHNNMKPHNLNFKVDATTLDRFNHLTQVKETTKTALLENWIKEAFEQEQCVKISKEEYEQFKKSKL